jgi:capsid protein
MDDSAPRLTPLDRAIAVFSPGRAAKRFAARVSLANLSRAYEGASKGRLTSGWRSTTAAADSIIAADLPTLRERSRELVRNNAFAAKSIQVLVDSAVGYGIRPRAKSANKRIEKKLNDLWDAWAAVCDADGHTNFDGLMGLAAREMFEGGEALLIRRWRRDTDGLPLPFQVEVREGEHFDDARNSVGGDSRISQGIEYNDSGRRVAYWLLRRP